MNLSILLHFYQPHNQQIDILDRIVNESYRPILNGLVERPHAKISANISGVLLSLFKQYGYEDLLVNIKLLVSRGQLELTGTAMYHALLPLLPKDEIKRQILLNDGATQEFLGFSMDRVGFFSPELAISSDVLEVLQELGFKWVVAEELAVESSNIADFYQDSKTNIGVMLRNKRISSLVLSASVQSPAELIKEAQDIFSDTNHWFAVMDAETFGHHRVGHEKLLFSLLDSADFSVKHIQELVSNSGKKPLSVDIRPCTWSNSEQDFWLDRELGQATTSKSFILWKDPSNPIHTLQWELVDHVLKTVQNYHENNSNELKNARELLDKALASDQFWWASAKPWWSLEMIEQGAFALKNVVMEMPDYENKRKDVDKADEMYRKILDQAFDWQRTGYIRHQHLNNSGTFMKEPLKERTPNEWFNQLVLEFEHEMNTAAANHNYEKAIKWRDAVKKISLGTDKYDVLHVVDELWSGRTVPWAMPLVKPFLQHEWEEFSTFAKEHFIDVHSKEEFEAWKSKSKSANL